MKPFLYWIKEKNWLIVLLAIVISFIYPSFGITLKNYSNYLLMFLVFLSCLDLKTPEIVSSFSNFRPQFLVLIITHLISPLLILPFRPFLSPELYLGLIITAVSPVGRSTAFLANIYGGNPVFALVSSTISNVLSPILMPALVWLFAHQVVKIDIVSMSGTLFWLVVVPLIVAFLFGKTKPGKKLNHFSSNISVIVLFFILLSIISPLKDTIIANSSLALLIAYIGIFLLASTFFLGYFIGKNRYDSITYGLTSAYKNYTLATIISLSMFSSQVSLVPIIYSIVNNFLLIPLSFFKTDKLR